MVCPSCNAETPAGAVNCPRCGYLLPGVHLEFVSVEPSGRAVMKVRQAPSGGGAQPYGAEVDSHSANAQRIVLILIATLGAMVGVLVVFMLTLYAAHVRGCAAMADAVALAEKSAEARAALGEPIRADWWVTGAVRDDREAGFALLTIPVHGSKASGKLTVVANRVGARWDLESLALRVNGQRLDLSPATQREAFDYPAEGRVYLLPMDEDAAVMLGDFPGYFKARLGIDVTILPMLPLADERLNVGAPGAAASVSKASGAGQASAEKVIDYMLREKPEILAELDSALIGVTSRDMTIESYGWRFATAYRRDGRFAIISTNRLREVPWYAGENPEVFPVRVRKVVLKNIALLHYPLDLSADPTSALAAGITSGADTDAMGENFLGESGVWQSWRDATPSCVTITRGPGGRQAWRIDCNDRPPNDSRYELFQNYTQIPLFIQARTDLPFGGEYPLPFTRVYRPKDPTSREFGIGATHSLGMMLYSEKAGTTDVDLCLADGARVAFHADGGAGTLSSLGQAKQDDAAAQAQAVLKSRAESGRFSLATLIWTGNDWRLKTLDGWTYQFMSNGVNHPGHEGVLTGIEVGPDEGFRFAWTGGFGKALRVEAPDHSWMEMEYDGQRRIRESRSSTGRAVGYEYDPGGRLVGVRDAENGDERYEYDAKNQMTAVLDAQGRALLKNTYNDAGDILEQVLADGRKLAYEYRRDQRGAIEWMKFTDPLGYQIEWTRRGNGYYTRTLPVIPQR